MSEQSVIEFTVEQFTDSPDPYEYLYNIENKFKQGQEITRLEHAAKALGIYNDFRRMWKAYQLSMNPGRNKLQQTNKTEFPGQPFALACGDYDCNEFGVSIMDVLRGPVVVCPHPIMPVRRIVNLDTNECKTELAYLRGKGWRKAIFEKSTLANAQKIVGLSTWGIAVDSESARLMVRYLSTMEEMNIDELPEEKSIGRLGWVDGYGCSPYVDGLLFDGQEQYRHAFQAVRQAGSFDAWKECVLKMRRGESVAARAMLAASFASVLIEKLNALPFILHVWSNVSGIGKTVALMAAGSVWADPRQGEYLKTYNSTSVGLEMLAGFYGSLPLCMDELCLRDGRRDQFDSMIYQYCEGVGRTRGSKQGGLQKTLTWKNCLISTGEEPITSGNSKAGAVNRVLDINSGNVQMFDAPREVVSVLTANFGHAGPAFIATLDDNSLRAIHELQEAYYRELEGTTTDKQRLSASILLAADAWATKTIFQDDRALTADDIAPYLQSNAATDINRRAYEWLMDTVSANPVKFGPQGGSYQGECWGTVEENHVYIIKSVFDRIMQEEGYNSVGFLQWARTRKLLSTDTGERTPRLTKRKRIPGIQAPARCVCIRIEDEDHDLESGYEITQESFPMDDQA